MTHGNQYWTPSRISRLTRLYKAGMPRNDIAEQMRVSKTSIANAILQYDITRLGPTPRQADAMWEKLLKGRRFEDMRMA